MNPRIVPRAEHTVSRKDICPMALKVLYRLSSAGYLAYLAGGGVRDLLLGRRPKDFDVVTDAHPEQVRRLFRNCRLIGRRFRLAHVVFGQEIIEVATFRSNVSHTEQQSDDDRKHMAALKNRDGQILRDNVFGTPEEDALRRDFTLNALFYDIRDFSIIDYVGGLDDVAHRTLRSIGDPRVRYVEDPIRMIRAIRFAAGLGLHIESAAWDALVEFRDRVALAVGCRLFEELLKLYLCGEAERVGTLVEKAGLYPVLFPVPAEWRSGIDTRTAHHRAGEALRQIDTWVREGRRIHPSVLFVMLHGEYIEHLAAERIAQGMRPAAALHTATTDALVSLGPRVPVPKQVVMRAAHLMGSRPLFAGRSGKRWMRFVGREYFEDAYDVFRFRCMLTGRNRELLEWWDPIVQQERRRREGGGLQQDVDE